MCTSTSGQSSNLKVFWDSSVQIIKDSKNFNKLMFQPIRYEILKGKLKIINSHLH